MKAYIDMFMFKATKSNLVWSDLLKGQLLNPKTAKCSEGSNQYFNPHENPLNLGSGKQSKVGQ